MGRIRHVPARLQSANALAASAPPLVSRRGAIALSLGALTAACGGGGGGGDSDSDEGGIAFISLSYQSVATTVGRAISISPTVSGLPNAEPTFSAPGLPAGLSINARSGVISGVPQEPRTGSVLVTLTVRGYSDRIVSDIYLAIGPALLYSATQLAPSSLPDLLGAATVRMNGVLYRIGATYTSSASGAVQTWRSTDEGLTWTNANVAPTTPLRYFSVAQGVGVAYLTGGVNSSTSLNTSEVWRFDGSTWTQVNASAPFPARRRHASLVADGALVVVGGVASNVNAGIMQETPSGYLNDVWRSMDGGVSWTEVAATSAFPPRFGHSLLTFNARLWLVGGHDGIPQTRVWSSADAGATWTLMSTLPSHTSGTSAPTGLAYSGCIVHRGRLVVIGGTGFALSTDQSRLVAYTNLLNDGLFYTADGTNWERQAFIPNNTPQSYIGRYGHSVIGSPSGPAGDSILLLGSMVGQINAYPGKDVWRFD